jgi:hypothetical protein
MTPVHNHELPPSGPVIVPKPATSYELTEAEYTHVIAVGNRIAQAKLYVYDLNVQLEELQKKIRIAVADVNATDQSLGGALSILADAHGFKQAKLSQDMKTLIATVV